MIFKKHMYGVFLFIVIVLVLETSLRIYGGILNSSDIKNNLVKSNDDKKVRILVLGESTSASLFGKGERGAWPNRLEVDLNNSGFPTKIYNLSVPGTDSAMIVANLNSYIHKFRPHIVISMMGINDNSYLVYFGESAVLKQLNEVRIIRLLKWSYEAFLDVFYFKKLEHYELTEDKRKYLDEALSLSQQHDLGYVENYLRTNIKNVKVISLIFSKIAQLKYKMIPGHNYLEAEHYALKAFDLYSNNYTVVSWALSIIKHNRSFKKCGEVAEKLKHYKPYMSDSMLAKIGFCINNGIVQNDFKEYLLTKGIGIGNVALNATARHYKYLAETLKQNSIQLIAMQYPTLELGSLQSYFLGNKNSIESQYSDIIFISNHENFISALAKMKYDDVFSDRFQGNWGHCQDIGHELINQKLLPVLKKLIKEKYSLI